MNQRRPIYSLIGLFLSLAGYCQAQISGHVTLPGNTQGIIGCTLRAYDARHHLIATAGTDAAGTYKLSVPAGQKVSIELEPPARSIGNQQTWFPAKRSSLQRIVAAPAADLRWELYQPMNSAQERSLAAVVLYVNGDPTGKAAGKLPGLVAFPTSDIFEQQNGEPSRTLQTLATAAQTGALWGLAQDPNRPLLYSAAFAKRHTGFGPLGSGGIYLTDLAAKKTGALIDLSQLGIPTGPAELPRDLSGELHGSSKDAAMFGWTGQMGLGGLSISNDGKTLYVMNLFDRTLYGLQLSTGPVPTVAGVLKYPVPLTAKGGNVRPFAVKYHAGHVWVGVVTDAAQSQNPNDLEALVYTLDADNTTQGYFTEVLRIPLNYTRRQQNNWRPWTQDFARALHPEHPAAPSYPQAILSDIAFDEDGAMILGFMDRFGHQSGTDQPDPQGYGRYTGLASGDVIRIAFSASKSNISDKKLSKHFSMERNATVGAVQSEGIGNGQGPAGGEFYHADGFRWNDREVHLETGAGGLALLPGTAGGGSRLLYSAHEPTTEFNTGGVRIFDNQTGKSLGGAALYRGLQAGYFAKANGVGDVEILRSIPQTSVGHKVWLDANENKIQDPDEVPMAGVQLEIYEKGNLVGSTTTNNQGEYWFDEQNITGGLKTQTNYEIRLAESDRRLAFRTGNAGENRDDLNFALPCSSFPTFTAQTVSVGNEVKLILSGYQPTDRYWLREANELVKNIGAADAYSIPETGIVLNEVLQGSEAKSYTIHIYDSKGCSATRTVAVDLNKNEADNSGSDFNVYPNPLTKKATVQFRSSGSRQATLQVIDASGRILRTYALTSADGVFSTTLNAESYPTGLLILKVQNEKGVFSKGVIKE